MKKLFSLILILALGLFAVTGCNQATSTSPTEIPDGADVASTVGGLMGLSTSIDGTARGLMGVASVSSAGLKAMEEASDLAYDGSIGWWTFTWTYGSTSYSFKARAYTALNEEIVLKANLGNMNKLVVVASYSIGAAVTYNFGTDANPMTFDGIDSGIKSLNGTAVVTLTDDAGHTFTCQLVYSGVTLNASGYPSTGSATFTFTSSDYVAVEAVLTYNGEVPPNETATLTFTAPTELAATSYTINLRDGTVTPASL
ncbi:hypothetical protein ACFL37_02095 [Candidatus Margulisiibacteriota bacterium]